MKNDGHGTDPDGYRITGHIREEEIRFFHKIVSKVRGLDHGLPFRANETILDIGCGHLDWFSKTWSGFPDNSVTGIDKETTASVGPKRQTLEGDFLTYDFNEKKFDVVAANSALTWILAPIVGAEKDVQELFWEKLGDVLKFGGFFVAHHPGEENYFPDYNNIIIECLNHACNITKDKYWERRRSRVAPPSNSDNLRLSAEEANFQIRYLSSAIEWRSLTAEQYIKYWESGGRKLVENWIGEHNYEIFIKKFSSIVEDDEALRQLKIKTFERSGERFIILPSWRQYLVAQQGQTRLPSRVSISLDAEAFSAPFKANELSRASFGKSLRENNDREKEILKDVGNLARDVYNSSNNERSNNEHSNNEPAYIALVDALNTPPKIHSPSFYQGFENKEAWIRKGGELELPTLTSALKKAILPHISNTCLLAKFEGPLGAIGQIAECEEHGIDLSIACEEISKKERFLQLTFIWQEKSLSAGWTEQNIGKFNEEEYSKQLGHSLIDPSPDSGWPRLLLHNQFAIDAVKEMARENGYFEPLRYFEWQTWVTLPRSQSFWIVTSLCRDLDGSLANLDSSFLMVAKDLNQHPCNARNEFILDLSVAQTLMALASREVTKAMRKSVLKQARTSAIAAIAAQSLSHNIGSHALSDARLFSYEWEDFKKDGPALKDFHQYLQGRMDYVAQLIAETPPQAEPMYLFKDVLCEFFRQRLLLNRLISDRSVEGEGLSFKVSFPSETGAEPKKITIDWEKIENLSEGNMDENWNAEGGISDVLVAIPGGSVGRHALFSIFENMMRNSAKYGLKRDFLENKNNLEISIILRDPGEKKQGGQRDFWLLEIWDNFSGFEPVFKKGETNGFVKLAESFGKDVIENDGKPATGGHGMIEIKEAMRFLHPHEDEDARRDESGRLSPWACQPDCHRTGEHPEICDQCQDHAKECCLANVTNIFNNEYGEQIFDKDENELGTLLYRVRLQRPRMVGVWCPGAQETAEDNVKEGIFFRKTLTGTGTDEGGDSLADLAPYLLVIRDGPNVNPEEVCEQQLAEQHWRLPYRLFVVVDESLKEVEGKKRSREQVWKDAIEGWVKKIPTVNQIKDDFKRASEEKFLPFQRVRLLKDDALLQELNEAQGDTNLSFINEVYLGWLKAFKPKIEDKPWHLVLCFERPDGAPSGWTEDFINQFNNHKNQWPENDWGRCAVFYGPKGNVTNPVGKAANEYSANICKRIEQPSPECMIHFGNHGSKAPGHAADAGKAFTQAYGSTEAPHTFQQLYSPPQKPDVFNFYLLRLMEAALTKVWILDERITSDLVKPAQKRAGYILNSNSVKDLQWANVGILGQIPSGTQDFAKPRNDLNLQGTPDKNDFSVNQKTFKLADCRDAATTPDVIALHEGLIEELVAHSRLQMGMDIGFLKFSPRIVRFSGKGPESRKLYHRHPFSEYSAIGNCFGSYKDGPIHHSKIEKAKLVSALLDSSGIQ